VDEAYKAGYLGHCNEAIMDFDDLKNRRSGLGTAAVIVMNN